MTGKKQENRVPLGYSQVGLSSPKTVSPQPTSNPASSPEGKEAHQAHLSSQQMQMNVSKDGHSRRSLHTLSPSNTKLSAQDEHSASLAFPDTSTHEQKPSSPLDLVFPDTQNQMHPLPNPSALQSYSNSSLSSLEPASSQAELQSAPSKATHSKVDVASKKSSDKEAKRRARLKRLATGRRKNPLYTQASTTQWTPDTKLEGSPAVRLAQIQQALQNRRTLSQYQTRNQTSPLLFDESGRLQRIRSTQQKPQPGEQYVLPTFEGKRLTALSVPHGLGPDSSGKLSEIHLELMCSESGQLTWSRVCMDLHAAPGKMLQANQKQAASKTDIHTLNLNQRLQLAFLIAPQLSPIQHDAFFSLCEIQETASKHRKRLHRGAKSAGTIWHLDAQSMELVPQSQPSAARLTASQGELQFALQNEQFVFVTLSPIPNSGYQDSGLFADDRGNYAIRMGKDNQKGHIDALTIDWLREHPIHCYLINLIFPDFLEKSFKDAIQQGHQHIEAPSLETLSPLQENKAENEVESQTEEEATTKPRPAYLQDSESLDELIAQSIQGPEKWEPVVHDLPLLTPLPRSLTPRTIQPIPTLHPIDESIDFKSYTSLEPIEEDTLQTHESQEQKSALYHSKDYVPSFPDEAVSTGQELSPNLESSSISNPSIHMHTAESFEELEPIVPEEEIIELSELEEILELDELDALDVLEDEFGSEHVGEEEIEEILHAFETHIPKIETTQEQAGVALNEPPHSLESIDEFEEIDDIDEIEVLGEEEDIFQDALTFVQPEFGFLKIPTAEALEASQSNYKESLPEEHILESTEDLEPPTLLTSAHPDPMKDSVESGFRDSSEKPSEPVYASSAALNTPESSTSFTLPSNRTSAQQHDASDTFIPSSTHAQHAGSQVGPYSTHPLDLSHDTSSNTPLPSDTQRIRRVIPNTVDAILGDADENEETLRVSPQNKRALNKMLVEGQVELDSLLLQEVGQPPLSRSTPNASPSTHAAQELGESILNQAHASATGWRPSSQRPFKRDETAIRRIQLDTLPLDPKALQLHLNPSSGLSGAGLSSEEHTLTIFEASEYRYSMLGVTILFSYSQSEEGKVYPRVTVKRTANVRKVSFAAYEMEICANRNETVPSGYDHIQKLPRGHIAVVDLSPTDQLRGVMMLNVRRPSSDQLVGFIEASWSFVE